MALWGDTATGDQRPKFLVDVIGNRGLRETFMTARGWTKLLDGHNPKFGLTEVLVAISEPVRTTGTMSPPEFTTPEQSVEFGVDLGELLEVLIIATDIEGSRMTYSKIAGPSFLTLTNNLNIGTGAATATLAGTPSAGDEGLHIINIEADDGDDTSILTFLVCVPAPPFGSEFVEILDTGFGVGYTTFAIPAGVNNIEISCFGARGGLSGGYGPGLPGGPSIGVSRCSGGKKVVVGINVSPGDILQIAQGAEGGRGDTASSANFPPNPPAPLVFGGSGGSGNLGIGTFNFPGGGNADGGDGAGGITDPVLGLFSGGSGGGGGATTVANATGTIFLCAGGGGGGAGHNSTFGNTSRCAQGSSNTSIAGGESSSDGADGTLVLDVSIGGGGGGFEGGSLVGTRANGGLNGDQVPEPSIDIGGGGADGRVIIRGRQLP